MLIQIIRQLKIHLLALKTIAVAEFGQFMAIITASKNH